MLISQNSIGFGIGVINPQATIHASSDIGSITEPVMILETHSNNAVHSFIENRSSRGTRAVPLDVNNGDFIGGWLAKAYDSVTTNYENGAYMAYQVAGVVTPGTDRPTKIIWATTPIGSITANAVMFLDSEGRLGIGTSTPQTKIQTLEASNMAHVTLDDGVGQPAIFSVNADPNGSLTGYLGSIAMDYANGTVWVNTDGATAWVDLNSGASGWQLNGNTNGVEQSIGTTDSFDFPIIIAGNEQARFTQTNAFRFTGATVIEDAASTTILNVLNRTLVDAGANDTVEWDTRILRSPLTDTDKVWTLSNTVNDFAFFTGTIPDPNTFITADPGDVYHYDAGGVGGVWVKSVGTANATGWTQLTGGGSALQWYAENATAPGSAPTVTGGTGIVAIGDGASVTAVNSFAIGNGANASAVNAIALGSTAGAGVDDTIAIGDGAGAFQNSSIAIGTGAFNQSGGAATQSTAIGYNAITYANADRGLALGHTASSDAVDSIAIGSTATINTGATGAIAIGVSSSVGGAGVDSIAIGNSATALAGTSVVIGSATDNGNGNSVVIGQSNSAGTFTVAIGSAQGSTNGVSIGTGIAGAMTTASTNVFIGNSIGNNTTDGSDNVVLGNSGFVLNNSGNRNIAIGTSALQVTTTDDSIALGNLSLGANTTGVANISIGAMSSQSLTTGSNNIAIGVNADISIAIDDGIAIGRDTTVTGLRAVALGQGTTASQDDTLILGDTTNTAVRVGIGTQAPTSKLHLSTNSANTIPITTHENLDGEAQDFVGNGSPEGVVTGSRGDLYRQLDGTGNVYKKTDDADNTGWEAFATISTTSGTQILSTQSLDFVATFGTTEFLGIHSADVSTVESDVYWRAPQALETVELSVQVEADTFDNTTDYELYVNGAGSGLIVSVAGGSAAGLYTASGTISIAQSDTLSFRRDASTNTVGSQTIRAVNLTAN